MSGVIESDLEVLFEDNHLLVVHKPAGLVTMGAPAGGPSLVEQARAYVRRKYDKPGKVYLGIVSRLDAVASGVIVLARTSKAARRLTDLFGGGGVEKTYWAVTGAVVQPDVGVCHDWLRKYEPRQRTVVARAGQAGAREARLAYRTLRRVSAGSALEISLATGRKHQIRVQLAHRGWPLLGDRKYGSRTPFDPGIALHARRLAFEHPVRKIPLAFEAPLPPSWGRFGLDRLG